MNYITKLAAIGALCAVSSAAYACSCMAPPAPKIALEKSAAVFVGQVASVEKGQYGNTFQFKVSKKWKGIDGDTASIVSASSSAACGINFDSDRDYLIYAFKTEGDPQLRTNLCTRTKRLTDAAADLAELGEPTTRVSTKPVVTTTYPTVNGVVQINTGTATDPLVTFVDALRGDENSSRFRVSWSAPTADAFNGTALYDRDARTLKVYSRARTANKFSVESALYRGVTDEVLGQLASSKTMVEFFTNFADYGVSREDLGSKTVRIRGER